MNDNRRHFLKRAGAFGLSISGSLLTYGTAAGKQGNTNEKDADPDWGKAGYNDWGGPGVPSEEGPMDDVLLKDYAPRSSLVTGETFVEKARFPVINVHEHHYPGWVRGKPLKAVLKDWLNTMDEVGIERSIILTSATGVSIARYSKRVLFGTDMGMEKGMYQSWWRLLESSDEYMPGRAGWRHYGLELPDQVLERLYQKKCFRDTELVLTALRANGGLRAGHFLLLSTRILPVMKKAAAILGWFLWCGPMSFSQDILQPDIPDALTFANGRQVLTGKDFQNRREEIKQLWCDYFTGHFPRVTPDLLSVSFVSSENRADGATRKRVLLTWDTPGKKSFEIELWIPGRPGPYPLLLTQPRFYQIPWAEEALKRGYLVCLYPGLDAHHKEESYPGYEQVWKEFQQEYPDATWGSSLAIQAWLAGRTLDYLLRPGSEYAIDTAAVGIIGHSRYGKQSIYAAAFDDRIKAVVARSSGTPTACPYRFAGRQTFMESMSREDCPEAWVIPRIREFVGREDALPVEGNALLALIAPRYLWLHTAYNDGSEPTFGVERTYLNTKKAYAFLGLEDRIRLIYRKGEHDPITPGHVIENIDYLDFSFGRSKVDPGRNAPPLLHHFDWDNWKNRSGATICPDSLTLEESVQWMLGAAPEYTPPGESYRVRDEKELVISKWSRDRWNPGGLSRVPFAFADSLNGNIYFDPQRKEYKGTVIWLHPWNYSQGSNEGYGVQGTSVYWRLAQEGYIVAAYDQFGFGEHLLYAADFYEKNPGWSILGRAVRDVRDVVSFLTEGKGKTAMPVPPTDPDKVYVCGFSYGGLVALYAAAMDTRLAGAAIFSGFTPMRSDTRSKRSGGLRRYYEWHSILPKLGFFEGNESSIPYDYGDLIKMIAPRKCLIYAPVKDRFADAADVRACVEKAAGAWNNGNGLHFMAPDDICRFQKDQQDALVNWLGSIR